MASNITHLTMEEGKVRWCTKALTQYDYGQRLVIDGIQLPSNYEVFFSNSERSEATTSIGDSTGVDIPDWVLESGECIFIWVFLHTGAEDGETVATGVIRVNPRSKTANEPPTPQQLDVISQLMAALNVSVTEAQALAADIPVRIQTALQEAKDSGEFNGPKGDTGAVFTPSVNDGVMSWTNNGGLPNPEPTNFVQELGLDRYATKQEVSGKIDSGLIGSPNGVAALDASGRIPSEQLPSYVDDILEYPSFQDFPSQGETGKIYIDLSNNYQYRWSGTQYINITGGDLDSRKADKRDTVLETTLSRGRQANTVAGAGSIAFGSGNTASGQYSTALGVTTAATGNSAHAEGGTTIAEGDQSHAEGYSTYAKGSYSHTEGEGTQALDSSAHAEGSHTHATGARSHAEGSYTQASGLGSHAEGSNTVASNNSAHAEGSYTEATNTASHVEGYGGESEGVASHAEGGYTSALEDYSHAEGYQSQAYEDASHAEGNATQARGEASHSEGISTYAYGRASHAEGEQTYANGARSHSEGYQTRATGSYSHSEGMGGTFTNQTVEYTSGAHGNGAHSEGYQTYANGTGAHAEGHTTVASVQYAHAEGTNTLASGYGGSHAEGDGTQALQDSSHAEGYRTQASEDAAHAEGRQTVASGLGSHAEGSSAQATGSYSHAEGGGTQATASGSHAEGSGSQATADNAHAEGSGTRATGSVSHAEGGGTTASGYGSHAEGGGTTASGSMSHAEGTGTTASNSTSHAEGAGTQATGANSHAEGSGSRAIGPSSHAEGSGGAASGYSSHVEGGGSTVSGEFAHAENQATIASGKGSHAEGYVAIARGAYSHVGGIHNIEDSYDNWTEWTPGEHCVPGDKRKRTQTVNEETIVEGFVCKTENMDAEWDKTHWFDLYGQMNYAVIIGNGYRDPNDQYNYIKSNAYTLDWDGNEEIAGRLKARGIGLGRYSFPTGEHSIAMSDGATASGNGSIAMGGGAMASGNYSHAMGNGVTASGMCSHAGGSGTTASGHNSLAHGSGAIASGFNAVAFGGGSQANGQNSMASGEYVQVNGSAAHVFGQNNIPDTVPDYDSWNEWVAGTPYSVGDSVYREITTVVPHEWGDETYTRTYYYTCIEPNSDQTFDENKWEETLYGRSDKVEIIGGGLDTERKANLRTLDWHGTERLMGDVYVRCNPDGTGGVKLGASAVDDVRIEGTSILQNGIANIPLASTTPGLVKINNNYGVGLYAGSILRLNKAEVSLIKQGVNDEKAIVPLTQDRSVFYGLAKAAGSDMKNSDNAVGTYTDEAKQAIQKMLGLDGILGDFESSAVASKAYAIGETFVYNGKRYRATAAIAISDVIAPGTNCELAPIDGHYVRDTDYPSNSTIPGVVKVNKDGAYGLRVSSETAGDLRIMKADDANIKSGTPQYKPIVPYTQHQSVFFGLSKAAGVDLASVQDVVVGTYPATAKAAILAMLGANGNGLQILNGTLATDSASTTSIKNAGNSFAPIVSSHIHDAAFFGLAKAAGADMASLSDVTVGVYPQAQKTAIQTMLGIEADIPLIEEVSGTTPTITGMPNVRYICGTCSLLTITPPASGSIVVRFTSGSTPTVLTVPNTVKFPVWFDAEALEADTVYEIIITDGVYGGVMSWAD